MIRTLAVCLMLASAAGVVHAVELSYATDEGTALIYKVSARGTVDVEGFGTGMYTEGRGEISVTPTGVLEDGATTMELILNKGYLSVGGTYLPSMVTKDVFSVTRDARGIITSVEGEGVADAPKDALLLGVSAALAPPLPEGAVEPGDTWSADYTGLGLDAEEISVTGECTLQEVRDDEGAQIAVIVSKITVPARFVYTDPMTGSLEVEVTTEIDITRSVVNAITAEIVGSIESAPSAFEPMKVTFNPLTVQLELQPPADE